MHRRPIVTFALALSLLSGCVAGSGGGGLDGTGAQGGAPAAAQQEQLGTYTALESPERDGIANDMWNVLTSAPCWYMEGTTTNYAFYGSLQYTYAGISDSKRGGTIGVVSVGRYQGKNAAVVSMSSDTWLMVVLDPQTFSLGKLLNGQVYIEVYRANLGPGACV